MARPRKEIIMVGKAIDAVDDLDNLSEPGPAGKYQRVVNKLKEAGITKISQLRKIYDSYGEEYTLNKLQELNRVGEELSLWIVLKAIDYKYPTGYTPKDNEIPNWVMKEEEKEEEPIHEISMDELEKVCSPEIPETEPVNIEEYSQSLIKDEELPLFLLEIIYDLFTGDTLSPERIKKPGTVKYDQEIMFYSDTIILIEESYLYGCFMEKYKDINTISNMGGVNAFNYAVEHIPGVYSYFNKRIAKHCYWGTKKLLLGDNYGQRYVEIKVHEAEQALNKDFGIIPEEQLNSTMKDIFNYIEPKIQEPETSKFYIVPERCNNGSFEFEILAIGYNRRQFQAVKKGKGVYSGNELLISRNFTNEEYDEIETLVKQFLQM